MRTFSKYIAAACENENGNSSEGEGKLSECSRVSNRNIVGKKTTTRREFKDICSITQSTPRDVSGPKSHKSA